MLAAVFTAASNNEIRRNIIEKANYYHIMFAAYVRLYIMQEAAENAN